MCVPDRAWQHPVLTLLLLAPLLHIACCRQMDSQVQEVVRALLEQAGPGGAHERTLLLVSGDHGQTLGGDHGGGSPEEVDSALVAVDMKALYESSRGVGIGAESVAGAGSDLGAPAACRSNCSCGVEGNQCAPDLPQTDLTPTLAAMLGLPTPFGNIGKLSAELWQLTAAHLPAGSDDALTPAAAAEAWERSLSEAVLANAAQVNTYLNTYADTAGASFSRVALAGLNSLFATLAEPAADLADLTSRQALQGGLFLVLAAICRLQCWWDPELP
jgi:phosphatidylinositol glycan class O